MTLACNAGSLSYNISVACQIAIGVATVAWPRFCFISSIASWAKWRADSCISTNPPVVEVAWRSSTFANSVCVSIVLATAVASFGDLLGASEGLLYARHKACIAMAWCIFPRLRCCWLLGCSESGFLSWALFFFAVGGSGRVSSSSTGEGSEEEGWTLLPSSSSGKVGKPNFVMPFVLLDALLLVGSV